MKTFEHKAKNIIKTDSNLKVVRQGTDSLTTIRAGPKAFALHNSTADDLKRRVRAKGFTAV